MNNAGQFFTNRVLKDWKEKSRVSMIKYNILSITDLFPHSIPHIYSSNQGIVALSSDF